MTVSWRRSADAAGWVTGETGETEAVVGFVDGRAPSGLSVLPQFKQNFAVAGLALPHDGQRPGRAAPQEMQNLLLSGVSELQLGHSMSAPHPTSR